MGDWDVGTNGQPGEAGRPILQQVISPWFSGAQGKRLEPVTALHAVVANLIVLSYLAFGDEIEGKREPA